MNIPAIVFVLLVGAAYPVAAQATRHADERDARRVAVLVTGLSEGSQADQKTCATELLSLGKRGVPHLLKRLKAAISEAANDEEQERLAKALLEILGQSGPNALGAAPVILEILPKMSDANAWVALRTVRSIIPVAGRLTDDELNGLRAEHRRRLRAALGAARRGMARGRMRGFRPTNWVRVIHDITRRNQIDPQTPTKEFALQLRRRGPDRCVICYYLVRRGAKAKGALDSLRAGLNAELNYAWRTAKRSGRPFQEQIPRDGFLKAAADAMIAIAPKDPQTAIAWGYRINFDPKPQERVQAVHELMKLGPKAKPALTWLIIALSRPDRRVKADVITMLGLMGPAANKAVPYLEKLCASKDKNLAVRAQSALAQIQETGRRE